MKRQKRRAKTTRSRPGPAAQPSTKPYSRREILGVLKFGVPVAAVFGGGGWYFYSKVSADMIEADLDRIGKGVPTVVQVHDPNCSSCRILQRAARAALADFDETELQYVVADLKSPDGRRLASRHGVGRTTLLLFDGKGRMRKVLAGVNSAEFLSAAFRRHVVISARRTGGNNG